MSTEGEEPGWEACRQGRELQLEEARLGGVADGESCYAVQGVLL